MVMRESNGGNAQQEPRTNASICSSENISCAAFEGNPNETIKIRGTLQINLLITC